MSEISINGISFYYEIHGNGTPLMLIAGLASDLQSWQPVLPYLSRTCQVIIPDNRGAGRTRPQDVNICISEMADDFATLIKKLKFRSVDILGHSMGGFIAIDLAVRYPDLVGKLILAGTSSSLSKRNKDLFTNWAQNLEKGADLDFWFRNLFYWIFSERFFKDETALNEAVKLAVDYPYPQSDIAFKNQVKAITEYNGTQLLDRIRSRTLVINGREDRLFPVSTALALARNITGAEFVIIDRAAHALYVEQPKTFSELVLDFLS